MIVTELKEGAKERRIVIAMVTDDVVLSRMASRWPKGAGPLESSWSNQIGSWCVRHFDKYGAAPKGGIRNWYERWAEGSRTEEEVTAMERLLVSLSAEMETGLECSSDQMVDEALEHVNAIKVRRLGQANEADLNVGQVGKALERIATFSKEELGEDATEDVLLDEGEVSDTFTGIDAPLIQLSGGWGKFFAGELARDSFVAIQAPEKTGKSYLLMEIALQGMLQRNRVAFIEVGDMSRRQIKRRLLTRIAEHPLRSPDGKWPCRVRVPTSLSKPPRGETLAVVEHRIEEFDAALDMAEAWNACMRLKQDVIKSNKSFFKLCVYPNSSVTVAGIRAKVKSWELAGWRPDLIVIDYADILASPDSKLDPRNATNETWRQLRRMSQELRCLVLTATQADADSYGRDTQDRRNFSEDKRKLSHVTGLVGINVTAKEKDLGLMRLNWIVAREIDFSIRRCCHVATCLPLANPCVLSVF